MGEKRRGLSRRGLLGVFGRGLREFRDSLDGVENDGAGTVGESPPPPAYDRLLRPPEEIVFADPAGPSRWTVRFEDRVLSMGSSLIVSGGDLPEHLVLVCVNEQHYAACSAECPVDGSDLIWMHQTDRLACPACGSQWRLDGELMQGPADSPIARFVVDAVDGTITISTL